MKKGFTLVELLAVIVILAILLVITVPAIAKITQRSRKTLNEKSIDLYVEAVRVAIQNYQIENGKYPSKFEDVEPYIEYNGSKVECGVKAITPNKKIYLDNCKIDGKEINYVYGDPICTTTKTGNISVGDKYECEVSSSGEKHTFYVLSIEGNKINLIMNYNICENGTETNSSNLCKINAYDSTTTTTGGPTVAINYLNNATSSWDYIPNLNETYTDPNYGTISLNGKARLPKTSELLDLGCKISGTNTCPSFIMNGINIQYTDSNVTKIVGINGYWTLDSSSTTKAKTTYYTGIIGTGAGLNANNYGVRPVISLNKINLG